MILPYGMEVEQVNKATKVIILFVNILIISLLAACGPSPEMKEEAEERVKQYTPTFEAKVEEAYGKDAELSDVKCDIIANTSGVDFSTTYSVGGMYGTINIDGKKYRANYDYLSNTFVDNVHSDTIYKELLESLPFDSSKYIDTKFGELYLPPEIDSFEKYISLNPDENKNATFRQVIYITTTEDLSSYKNTDFDNISEIKKLNESIGFFTLKIVCLNDKTKSSSIMSQMDGIHFEYSDKHPMVQAGGESKDVFDEYDIKNAIEYPNQWQENHVMYMD